MLGVKMCAKKKVDDEPEPVKEGDELEDFVSQYIDAYRSYLTEKDMDERHLPQFYKGFPFVAEVYRLPNEAVCVLFRKSNRSKLMVLDGEYDDVKSKLDERALDFMQVFPPYTNFNQDEAERLAHLDAERDLKVSRRLEILSATEIQMKEIHEDINGMLELNPWLDEQTKGQKEKLDKAKELILELFREVETDEEERFAYYARAFMDIMAFERAEIEEVTGEIELQLETTLEEIDERVAKIEESFETYGNTLNQSMDELEQTVKETKFKVDTLEESEGTSDEVDVALRKVRNSLKDTNSKMTEMKKEMKEIQKDVTISGEIKDTVFRDSKRMHSLNERVSDLEKSINRVPNEVKKEAKSQMKALEGKINVIEKDLKSYTKDAVKKEVARSMALIKVEAPPPPPDTPPKGATVKKTRKKTTTKKSISRK
jgi:methyl-accepting chemotaxis protein